jgi:hypothetical protein
MERLLIKHTFSPPISLASLFYPRCSHPANNDWLYIKVSVFEIVLDPSPSSLDHAFYLRNTILEVGTFQVGLKGELTKVLHILVFEFV